MSDEALQALQARLDAVERENQTLRKSMRRRGYVFAFVAVLVVTVTGAANQERIEKAIEIKDNKGKLRAVLFGDNGGNKAGLEIRVVTYLRCTSEAEYRRTTSVNPGHRPGPRGES